MKEIKSTIVGAFLVLLGAFYVYSDKIDVHSNNYVLYACFGLISFGVYLILTTQKSRKEHFNIFISLVKKKVE